MNMVDMVATKDYYCYCHCNIMDFALAFLLVHRAKVITTDEQNWIAVCRFKGAESQAAKKMSSQDGDNLLVYYEHPSQRQIAVMEDLLDSMDEFFMS